MISSAFSSARGVPVLSKSVKLPFGVVDCELASDRGGVKGVVEELLDIERESKEDDTEARSSEGLDVGFASGAARVTILTPIPSLL